MTAPTNLCWARTGAERLAIEARHRSLIGSTFVTAIYMRPGAVDLGSRPRYTGFDVSDVGVELRDDDGRPISAVWRMEGFIEGLAFGPGTAEEEHGLYPLAATDVSREREWEARLGRPVVDVRTAWHIPNEGCPEAVWGVQLVFDGGLQVMLALGQPGGRGDVEYQPDEVVVIFDSDLARGYRVPASTSVDWAG
jgi:hypothetical protein